MRRATVASPSTRSFWVFDELAPFVLFDRPLKRVGFPAGAGKREEKRNKRKSGS